MVQVSDELVPTVSLSLGDDIVSSVNARNNE